MMTNKEVVSVQKLQMTYPLSAKKIQIQKIKRTLQDMCIKIWQLGSQSGGSKVAVVSFILCWWAEASIDIICYYIKGRIPLQILFHCQISAACDVQCIPGVTLRWSDLATLNLYPLHFLSYISQTVSVQIGGIVKHQCKMAALKKRPCSLHSYINTWRQIFILKNLIWNSIVAVSQEW